MRRSYPPAASAALIRKSDPRWSRDVRPSPIGRLRAAFQYSCQKHQDYGVPSLNAAAILPTLGRRGYWDSTVRFGVRIVGRLIEMPRSVVRFTVQTDSGERALFTVRDRPTDGDLHIDYMTGPYLGYEGEKGHPIERQKYSVHRPIATTGVRGGRAHFL